MATTLFNFNLTFSPPPTSSPSLFNLNFSPKTLNPSFHSTTTNQSKSSSKPSNFTPSVLVNGHAAAQVEANSDADVAEGVSMSDFCDKVLDLFLNEKPKAKDWKKYLIFREEWCKYRQAFYNHCKVRADSESDVHMRQKLVNLARKVKKVDEEMDRHAELLKEVQDSPMDVNAIVARRRRDFTEEFFKHLTLLLGTYDSLEDRDGKMVGVC